MTFYALMIKHCSIFTILIYSLVIGQSFGAEQKLPDDFRTTQEILNRAPDETKCSTTLFANALAKNAGAVTEYDDEETIQSWIYGNFYDADVLRNVLKCPEFRNADETAHIKLQPIKYVFPGGREIVINYETQPKFCSNVSQVHQNERRMR